MDKRHWVLIGIIVTLTIINIITLTIGVGIIAYQEHSWQSFLLIKEKQTNLEKEMIYYIAIHRLCMQIPQATNEKCLDVAFSKYKKGEHTFSPVEGFDWDYIRSAKGDQDG